MSDDIVKKLREKHWRGGGESNDECAIRRQKEREDGADLIEAQAEEITRLRAVLSEIEKGGYGNMDQLKKRVAKLEEQNKKLHHVISVLVETDKLRTALKELGVRQNPSQHAVTAVELLNDAAPY